MMKETRKYMQDKTNQRATKVQTSTYSMSERVRRAGYGWLGIVAAVGLLFAAPQAHAGASVDKGSKVPTIKAKGLDGKTVDLKAMLKKNKVVIVDFWASWCKPCKKELPFLVEMHKKYGSKGLGIIGVNVDKDPAKMNGFLKGKGVKFPIVPGSAGKDIAGKYSPPNMPTSYLVGPDGKVKHIHKGFHNSTKAEMKKQIEGML